MFTTRCYPSDPASFRALPDSLRSLLISLVEGMPRTKKLADAAEQETEQKAKRSRSKKKTKAKKEAETEPSSAAGAAANHAEAMQGTKPKRRSKRVANSSASAAAAAATKSVPDFTGASETPSKPKLSRTPSKSDQYNDSPEKKQRNLDTRKERAFVQRLYLIQRYLPSHHSNASIIRPSFLAHLLWPHRMDDEPLNMSFSVLGASGHSPLSLLLSPLSCLSLHLICGCRFDVYRDAGRA